MTPKINLKELASRESEQVEWKKNVADIDNVLRTVAAFANDFQNLGGGYVVCGAEESKDEHGFQKVDFPGLTSARFKEIEGQVLHDARNKIDPPVTPLVEEIPGSEEGKRVLVFIVPASSYAHAYRSSGKDSSTYFVRISRETVEAKNGVLRELLVRKQALEPWDRRLCSNASLQDIDLLAFREVLQEAGLWNPSLSVEDYFAESMRLSALVPPLGGTRPLDSVLHPRNFAMVLFGKEPTRFFPGAWTKVSFYPGKDRGEATSERHELTGPIIHQAKKALDLLKTHSSTVFDKESPDPNAPKYPERALQEAVINAIVHRDYEQENPTNITVFSDRVEIISPGSLPRTVEKTKFLEGRAAPSWRNQSLAYFFNKLQLAQAEGQGIPTILRTMKQLGSPSPSFEIEDSSVTCTLPAHPRHEMLRHVAEIERLLVQQDFDHALGKLTPLLDANPSAPQFLEVFAQIAITRATPERVGAHIREHKIEPVNLPASTVFQLASAMGMSGNPNDASMSKEWMVEVSKRKLEAGETRRVALGLRKIGQDEDAVQLINRFASAQASAMAVPAFLFDIRARAKIDLAKKCMDSGRDRSLSPAIQARAWDQCRRYLDEAESDVLRAIENEPIAREREFYERDLEFLRQIRDASKKPEFRQPRGRDHSVKKRSKG